MEHDARLGLSVCCIDNCRHARHQTVVEGAFSAHVVGAGGYAYINDLLYLEATAYRTLDFGSQNAVGVDPFGAPGLIDGLAPYWRVALEPHWGNHDLMVGTFGMITNIHNWVDPTFAIGSTGTFSQTDKFTDIGFDSQYQYQGENYWLTVRGSLIHEFQRLDSTFGMGGAANLNNDLNSLHLQASFAFGGDNRFVLTGQYFNLWGTSDPIRPHQPVSGPVDFKQSAQVAKVGLNFHMWNSQ
jgi:hypothetical protein